MKHGKDWVKTALPIWTKELSGETYQNKNKVTFNAAVWLGYQDLATNWKPRRGVFRCLTIEAVNLGNLVFVL